MTEYDLPPLWDDPSAFRSISRRLEVSGVSVPAGTPGVDQVGLNRESVVIWKESDFRDNATALFMWVGQQLSPALDVFMWAQQHDFFTRVVKTFYGSGDMAGGAWCVLQTARQHIRKRSLAGSFSQSAKRAANEICGAGDLFDVPIMIYETNVPLAGVRLQAPPGPSRRRCQVSSVEVTRELKLPHGDSLDAKETWFCLTGGTQDSRMLEQGIIPAVKPLCPDRTEINLAPIFSMVRRSPNAGQLTRMAFQIHPNTGCFLDVRIASVPTRMSLLVDGTERRLLAAALNPGITFPGSSQPNATSERDAAMDATIRGLLAAPRSQAEDTRRAILHVLDLLESKTFYQMAPDPSVPRKRVERLATRLRLSLINKRGQGVPVVAGEDALRIKQWADLHRHLL